MKTNSFLPGCLLAVFLAWLSPVGAAVPFGWGYNNFAQLGDGTTTQRLTPVTPVLTGVLAGKSISKLTGHNHMVTVLTSDGLLFSWGADLGAPGFLGHGSDEGSAVPVAVVMSGVLAGKTVTDVDAGTDHVLVLTSEGKVYAWGDAYFGALGNGLIHDGISYFPPPSLVPDGVIMTGVLAGKTVTKISAGGDFSLALTSEGKIYSWGSNITFQLGNGTQDSSAVPVEVSMNGELLGKTVTDISAGQGHSLALTSEGKVYAWGSDGFGQLGLGSSGGGAGSPSLIEMNGVLAGKTVTQICAGVISSMALTSDGKVYAWGGNDHGQLGDGTTTERDEPVAMDMTGALAGKTVTAIVAANGHHIVLTSDGKVYACGENDHGQLGDGTTTERHTAVPVVMTGPLSRQIATAISSDSFGGHLLAAADPAPFIQVFNGVGTGGTERTDNAGTFFFPNIPLHEQSVKPFTIRNDGQLPLEGLAVTVSGPEAADFTPLALSATTLAAGETATFHLRFSPSATGNRNAVVSVTSTSSGVYHNPFRINVRGSGAEPLSNDAYGWGGNTFGQIGDGSTATRTAAARVSKSGVLSGRFLRALEAGQYHMMALSQEGQVFTWGANDTGQLGNGTQVDSPLPVAVVTTGALVGQEVSSISAGGKHCLALTTEGKLYAWGDNGQGQLGIGSYLFQTAPVAVGSGGLIDGKTVIAIEAGLHHSFAVTADGMLYAWGYNSSGRLGLGGGSFFNSPVQVTGALAGKFIQLISAGPEHTVATTTDNQFYAWGDNGNGAFGNGTLTSSSTPVLVDVSSIPLPPFGGFFTDVSAGATHTVVISGVKAYAWGANESGQLGDGTTTQRTTPVEVDTSGALSGKNLSRVFAGAGVTRAFTTAGAEHFGWGAFADGQEGGHVFFNRLTPVAGEMSGLLEGKTLSTIVFGAEHVSVLARGTQPTEADIAVTQPANAELQSGAVRSFGTQTVGSSQTMTFTISNAGTAEMSGLSASIDGDHAAEFLPTTLPAATVTAGDSTTLVVTFTPSTSGTRNAALHLTSNDPNEPSFDIILAGNGGSPSGQDFLGWGNNGSGRIGDGTSTDRSQPVAIDKSGALWGKTIAAVESGWAHTLVQTTDGRLYAWGSNVYGELGNSTNSFSNTAVPVDMHRGLHGLSVAAISARDSTCAALTTTGRLLMWGKGTYGQLGHGSNSSCDTPYPVDVMGLLSGKTITGVSVGEDFTLALTSDGKVYAWGLNNAGQLGTGATGPSQYSPVAVNMTGVLAGKVVTAISAWSERALALTTEGKVYAWGSNWQGGLGDGSTTDSAAPVAVDTSGVLAGKTVSTISCGYNHALALTTEGKVYGWGLNSNGELGDSTITQRISPVALDMSGALAGKTVVAIRAGFRHSLALTSQGRLYAWGYLQPSLGNGVTISTTTPVEISGTGLLTGRIVTAFSTGMEHIHAITTPVPQPPAITAPTVGALTHDTAVLGANVTSAGDAPVTERGIVLSKITASSSPQIGGVGVTKIIVTGTTGVFATTAAGLLPDNSYAFAGYAINSAGTSYTSYGYFTTLNLIDGWRQTYFPGSTSTTGPGADTATPHNDGIPNLMKFALGMDPTKPGTLPVAVDAGGEFLSFTYTPSAQAVAAGVQFRVEFSHDLSEFSWSWEIVNQGTIGPGGVPVTATAPKPPAGGGFMRLKVTAP